MQDFYIPAMSVSSSYDRAVGYFSSSALLAAARGLYAFISGGGVMRLIASPHLSEDDTRAISEGVQSRDDLIDKVIERELLLIELSKIARDRLKVLSWLLSRHLLDVQLAFKKGGGLYHEKLGIFRDTFDNVVAFTGSPNESVSGLCDNYENIDVFRSWVAEDSERVNDKLERFSTLWADERRGVQVRKWSDRLSKLSVFNPPLVVDLPNSDYWELGSVHLGPNGGALDSHSLHEVQPLPAGVELREYQKHVIRNWIGGTGSRAGSSRGIFKMATGTGKTITALAAASFLWRRTNVSAIIVVCPYQHLVDQWADEAESFGFDPIKCMQNSASWQPIVARALQAWRNGIEPGVILVTTHSSFGMKPFQAVLTRLCEAKASTLLIADEVHNYGNENFERRFPEYVEHRIGLSATPERYLDPLGTKRIFDYFGGVVEPEIGLREALELGVLCPYVYKPIFVTLEGDQLSEYVEITRSLARMFDSQAMGGNGMGEPAKTLLMKRARLIARTDGKFPALRKWLRERAADGSLKNALIYCGDGQFELSESVSAAASYPERVASEVESVGATPATFLAGTLDRKSLLSSFERGKVDVLVAIRCLDEGIDVPNIGMAMIMASGRNPKQFIQRRGRLLRRAPGKTRAVIYDMLVVPPRCPEGLTATMRSLVRAELGRAFEFAQLAENRIEAEACFVGYQVDYELFDLAIDDPAF